MRNIQIFFAVIVLALAPSSFLAAQTDDERAIKEIQTRWDEAWNRHDPQALGALVAEDVRFVNVAGVVLTGRKQFEQL